MLKKFASLLLALLLCLPLLAGQARAESLQDPVEPPAAVEPLAPETPEEPEAPLMPMGGEMPGKENDGHTD